MRIRVIVPITSPDFNEMCSIEAKTFLSDEAEVDVVSLTHGPASIESYYDEILAAPHIVEAVQKAEDDGIEGVFITCFGDPGVDAARELVDIPVVGGFQPAVSLALTLGDRFGIVTVLDNVVPMIHDLVAKMGVTSRMASVRVIDTPVLALHDGEALVTKLFEEAQVAVTEDGAHVLILGCTGMMGVAAAVQDRLSDIGLKVPVIDPTGAALSTLRAYETMGVLHSRLTYMTPPEKART